MNLDYDIDSDDVSDEDYADHETQALQQHGISPDTLQPFYAVTAKFGAYTWRNYTASEISAWDLLCDWAEDADRAPDHAVIRLHTP